MRLVTSNLSRVTSLKTSQWYNLLYLDKLSSNESIKPHSVAALQHTYLLAYQLCMNVRMCALETLTLYEKRFVICLLVCLHVCLWKLRTFLVVK